MAKRILATWVGHTDLRAMAAELPPERRTQILDIAKGIDHSKPVDGPVRTLLRNEQFDGVHILSNYPAWVNKEFAQWLGGKPHVHAVKIASPVDYPSIFLAVDEVLSAVSERGAQLSILLSPGTPAMTAVWVLLGKSKYPATFYQTHDGMAFVTDIPFDLTVDLLPDLLRNADTAYHHLASQGPQQVDGFGGIVGDSAAIRIAVGRAQRAALRDVSVLLLGESGTGKELFARAIHAASSRKSKPFVAINCAGIPRDLLESHLFGHVKGAFTGADKDRDGALKDADGGVLFLDEIGELDLPLQAKLLRALQPSQDGGPCTREFSPVGSTKAVRADVRLIAATNRDLVTRASSGDFRADLYYRLAAVTVTLPALRERKVDIPAIADAILTRINQDFERQELAYQHKSLSADAKAFVKRYPWPGNVRELQNAILQAAVMCDGQTIGRADIQAALPSPALARSEADQPLGDDFNLEEHLQELQRQYLQRAMAEAKGVKAEAARLLGYRNYQTLDHQLKRLGVKWEAPE